MNTKSFLLRQSKNEKSKLLKIAYLLTERIADSLDHKIYRKSLGKFKHGITNYFM